MRQSGIRGALDVLAECVARAGSGEVAGELALDASGNVDLTEPTLGLRVREKIFVGFLAERDAEETFDEEGLGLRFEPQPPGLGCSLPRIDAWRRITPSEGQLHLLRPRRRESKGALQVTHRGIPVLPLSV